MATETQEVIVLSDYSDGDVDDDDGGRKQNTGKRQRVVVTPLTGNQKVANNYHSYPSIHKFEIGSLTTAIDSANYQGNLRGRHTKNGSSFVACVGTKYDDNDHEYHYLIVDGRNPEGFEEIANSPEMIKFLKEMRASNMGTTFKCMAGAFANKNGTKFFPEKGPKKFAFIGGTDHGKTIIDEFTTMLSLSGATKDQIEKQIRKLQFSEKDFMLVALPLEGSHTAVVYFPYLKKGCARYNALFGQSVKELVVVCDESNAE